MRHLSGGLTVVRAQFAPNSVQFNSVQLNSVRFDWAGFEFRLRIHFPWWRSRIHYPSTKGWGELPDSWREREAWRELELIIKIEKCHFNEFICDTLRRSESKQRKMMFINMKIALFAFRCLPFIQRGMPRIPPYSAPPICPFALVYWHCRRELGHWLVQPSLAWRLSLTLPIWLLAVLPLPLPLLRHFQLLLPFPFHWLKSPFHSWPQVDESICQQLDKSRSRPIGPDESLSARTAQPVFTAQEGSSERESERERKGEYQPNCL